MTRKSVYLLIIFLQQAFIQSEGSCVSEYFTREEIINYRRIYAVHTINTNCEYQMIYNPRQYNLKPEYSTNYQYSDNVDIQLTTTISASLISKINRDSFTGTSTITSMSIENAYISEIDNDAFEDFGALKFLILSGNNLTIIMDKTFSSLTNLERLDVRNNKISNVETDAFAKLTKLEKLDVSFNIISNINAVFDSLESLKELDVSHNKLVTIGSLSFKKKLKSLQKVNLSNNKILTIEKRAFSDLVLMKEINLSNNLINKIDFEAFEILESINHMHLSNNYITELDPLENLQSLITLNLDNNSLVEIGMLNFNKHTNLTELNLRENQIQSMAQGSFAYLRKLKRLDLSKNLLTSLNTGTFSGLYSLEYLNISRNRINALGFPFHNTPAIQTLDLSGNKLRSFDISGIPQAKILDIQGNPLSCFDLTDLLKKLKSTNITLVRGSLYGEISIHGIPCEEDEEVIKTEIHLEHISKELRQILENFTDTTLSNDEANKAERMNINNKLEEFVKINHQIISAKIEEFEDLFKKKCFTDIIMTMKNISAQEERSSGNLNKLMTECKYNLYILAIMNFAFITILGLIFIYFKSLRHVSQINAQAVESLNELKSISQC